MAGTRQGVTGGPIDNAMIMKGWKLAALTVVLAADNYQITKDHPPVLFIDPAGAKDVLLPALDAETKGLTFLIFNTDADDVDITLKTSADGAIGGTTTIKNLHGAIVTNDGTTWFAAVGANATT